MTRRLAYVALPLLLIAAGLLWLVHGGTGPGPMRLRGAGEHHTVQVELEPGTGPLEVRVELRPASPAKVSIFAVMPHMGHTTPEITAREDGAGRYLARGELFTMPGAWEIGIRVHGRAGIEVIKINTLVGE